MLVSVFVASCSSDDDNGTKVKYEISGIDNAVTQIKYKKGNGSIVTLNDYNSFGSSKTVKVSDYPFTANLEVTVNNTTGSAKAYTLIIYVDGEAADFTPLVVPSNATSTGVVDFVVESE